MAAADTDAVVEDVVVGAAGVVEDVVVEEDTYGLLLNRTKI